MALPPSLETLVADIDAQSAEQDWDRLRETRKLITIQYADTEEAAEAYYRLGVDALFVLRDLSQALEHFKAAASKRHVYWSKAARTSMGICLYHQGNTKDALYQLGRVTTRYPDPPTSHSITALAFVETIYDSQGDAPEAKRVRKERIRQLQAMIDKIRPEKNKDLGQYLFELALALQDEEQGDEAKAQLDEAKHLGPDILGASLYQAVVAAY